MRSPPDGQLNLRSKGAGVSTNEGSSKCTFPIGPVSNSAHLRNTVHSFYEGGPERNKLQKAVSVATIEGLHTALPASRAHQLWGTMGCTPKSITYSYSLAAAKILRTLLIYNVVLFAYYTRIYNER
jgi:hypothetical protein